MDPNLNPYAPGAGRPPAALVGRTAQLEAWTVTLERIERGLSIQPITIYGLRGVGKTVLLTRLAREASDRQWLVAQLEAGTDKPLRVSLGEALHRPLAARVRPTAGQRLRRALRTALSFKASYDTSGTWSFGLDLDPDDTSPAAATGVLETDLDTLIHDLSEAAAEDSTGFALLIDEAQSLTPEELTAVCAAAHRASQQGWPFVLCLAGLPSLPKVLAEAKSYAERLFAYHQLAALPATAAAQALTLPAAQVDVTWHDDAVDLVVTATAGYPYFLQQYGQDTWNAAEQPALITREDARVGVATGQLALDLGFFRARWERATRSEQTYLRAMATLGEDSVPTGEIAALLGRPATSLTMARSSLIAKGLIYTPAYGRLAFTVPGMGAFITRQPDPDAP